MVIGFLHKSTIIAQLIPLISRGNTIQLMAHKKAGHAFSAWPLMDQDFSCRNPSASIHNARLRRMFWSMP